MMLLRGLVLLLPLFNFSFGLKYDPAARPRDEVDDYFDMEEFKALYADWESIEMLPQVKFYPIEADKLLWDKEQAKGILDHISGEMFLAKLKINGFQNQSWEYWTAPSGTTKCEECTYKVNGTEGAERYYGAFNARLESLQAKLNVTVDGEKKECDVVGITLKRNSVAHATAGGKRDQTDNLNMFHLLYDFAFISSPPIGIEIKEWTVIDDWSLYADASRFYLETLEDNSTWPPREPQFFSPLFHVYVDHQCLGISYSQAKYFNLKLSEHLDLKISGLVASAMKSHFLIQSARPYALYKLQNSNHTREEWAMEMITSEQGLFGDVGQWFEGKFKTVVTGLESAKKWGSQAFEDAKKWTVQAAKDVKNFGKNTWEWAKTDDGERSMNAVQNIANTVAAVANAAKAVFTG